VIIDLTDGGNDGTVIDVPEVVVREVDTAADDAKRNAAAARAKEAVTAAAQAAEAAASAAREAEATSVSEAADAPGSTRRRWRPLRAMLHVTKKPAARSSTSKPAAANAAAEPPKTPPAKSPSKSPATSGSTAYKGASGDQPAAKPKAVVPKVATEGKSSKAAAMAAMFNKNQAAADEESKSNPFSKAFDPNAKGPKKGEAGYGRAKEGTEADRRAKAAQAWVDQQIDQMIVHIRAGPARDKQGRATVTFGEIFEAYADVSDTLVGILLRARKRKRLDFVGDMLFQGMSDKVVITVLDAPPE
jgi:hypothetical protein